MNAEMKDETWPIDFKDTPYLERLWIAVCVLLGRKVHFIGSVPA